MKILFSIRFLTICLFSSVFFAGFAQVNAQSVAQLETDNGFLGIPLGKADTALPYLIPNGKTQKLHKFRMPDEKLNFNGIPLVSMMIYTFRDQIHSIDIKTHGAQSNALQGYFENRYGTPEQAARFDTKVYWQSDNVVLFTEKNLMTEDTKFSFVSLPVQKAYERFLYEEKYGKIKKK